MLVFCPENWILTGVNSEESYLFIDLYILQLRKNLNVVIYAAKCDDFKNYHAFCDKNVANYFNGC